MPTLWRSNHIQSRSLSIMSSSTYYNLLDNSPNRQQPKVAQASQVPASNIGMMPPNRHASSSPSSFVTSSSSTSNSSLNQFNSLTPLSMGGSLGCNNSSSSSSSSSSSTSSSSSFSSSAAARLSENVISSRIVHGASDSFQAQAWNPIREDNDEASLKHLQCSDNERHSKGRSYANLLRKTSITPPQDHTIPPSQMCHSYTLHSLDSKPLKPFKSNSEYLEAMKEDISEWLNRLYADLDLNTENFFSTLETGSVICRHANRVVQMGRDHLVSQQGSPTASEELFSSESDNFDSEPNNNQSMMSLSRDAKSFSITSSNSLSWFSNSSDRYRDIDWFRIKRVPFKSDALPGTFFARDNICQFILWCRSLNIRECLLFETDDLVSRKNVKSFILCLLEVARIGFKVGMPTPLIIQLEQEIDREIENDAKLAKQLELEKQKRIQDSDNSEDSLVSDFSDDGVRFDDRSKAHQQQEQAAQGADIMKGETIPTTTVEDSPSDTQDDFINDCHARRSQQATAEEEQLEKEEDFGPKPQVITNDLLSLHERVVQLLCQCTCPKQFPMQRIGDNGKYKVGDKLIIFVRILRRHIMVRVGGGWQELSEFLRLKDPCRSRLYQPQSIAFHNQSIIPTGIGHNQIQQHNRFGISPNSNVLRSRLGDSTYFVNKDSHIPTCRTILEPGSNGRGQHRVISSSASMSYLSHT